MNSSGTYTISFTPTQSSVQLSIAYSYFNMNANTLCFTLDSVNYQQQSASVSSTQLVQVCNKINDGYRFGYNGQEKVDEIAGAGNHTTAEFWEYDTRLGRRWNRDPVVKPWESSYACFANNPIWYSDVNGDDPATPLVEDHNEAPLIDGPNDPIGGDGGSGARTGGGGNSKNSVGADQLKKYSPLLQAQGFGIADNGGGNGGECGFAGSGRLDLGVIGNFIRNQAGSEFSKDLFQNYWQAGGDIALSQTRFKSIVRAAGNIQQESPVTLENGQPGMAKVHSFYTSPLYAKALGSATIYYSQSGKPVGFKDTYNFNWRFQWGQGSRSIVAEQQTRGVSIAGFLYGAKPFDIKYGIGIRP
jgi:hypothetical protein